MTHDTIVMYEDHADEIEPTIHLRGTLDYMQFLAHYWMQTFGWELPEVPDEPGQNVRAVVNHGRWIAGCGGCYSGLPLSRNYTVTICPRCGSGGWARVVYPDNRDEIERELLKQPGHRLFAPFRNWVPSWSIEFLRQRTEAANRQLREGVVNPRAASIGTPRIWSVGEILTASNMNTYLSEIDRDLIGINGAIELLHGVRPGAFTTAQIAALTGIPDGTLVYNQTLENIQLMIGDTARAMVPSHTSDLFAVGEIVTVTHDLGVEPTRFQLAYERIASSAQYGYANGDRLYMGEGGLRPGWQVYDVSTTEYKVVTTKTDDANIWVVDDQDSQLWRINFANTLETTGDFGLLGVVGSGNESGLTFYDGALWLIKSTGSGGSLWKLDPDNVTRTDGGFGQVGTFVSTLANPTGVTAYDGALWVVNDNNNTLWKIDPTDPGSTTGDFGEVGALPSGLSNPVGITFQDSAFWVIDDSDDTLWKIDPDNPGSTTGDFGDAGTLPSGLSTPAGITAHDGALYVVDRGGSPDSIWKIDPTNPDKITDGFGNFGGLPSGITFPAGIAAQSLLGLGTILQKEGDDAGETIDITVDNDASAGGWGARLLAFA